MSPLPIFSVAMPMMSLPGAVSCIGGTGASVVTNESIVARFGATIPMPFAQPPTRNGPASAVAALILVSVVQIASANCPPPS